MSVKGKISVIIPSYNYGKFLEECLKSVVIQAYTNWEAVIVDDGSTDQTPDIAPQVAALALSKIRYFRTENRGVTAARNFGIERSDGEFILPLDADDLLAPTALEDFANALARGPDYGFAYSGLENFNLLPGESSVWMPGMSTPRSIGRDNPAACTSLWRRSLWESGVRYREAIFEDWDLWLQIVARGLKGIYVPKPLFRYRIHPFGRHTLNKNRYLQAWIQEITLNPALYSDALKDWAANGLVNAPQSFMLPSVVFLPADPQSFKGPGIMRVMAEEFLRRQHFIIVIAGPAVENENLPGSVFLRTESAADFKMFEEHIFKMGREVIVFSEHSKELSLRLLQLNNVSTVVSTNPQFDANADFNLKHAGGLFEIDKRGMPVLPKSRDLSLTDCADQVLSLHAMKMDFKRGLEQNFYERLIRLSQYKFADLRSGSLHVEQNTSFSVIIPVGPADAATLGAALESFKGAAKNHSAEIIVVADSTALDKNPGLQAAVEAQAAKLVRYSFSDLWSRARACNIGVRAASNKTVIFAEPDVICHSLAFDMMRLYAYEMSRSCILTCNGRMLPFARPLMGDLKGFDFEAQLARSSFRRRGISVMALDRELFTSLGGFNEGHFDYGFEKEELIYRARYRDCRAAAFHDESFLQQRRVRSISTAAYEKGKELLREAERDPLVVPHWIAKTTPYSITGSDSQAVKDRVLQNAARVEELEKILAAAEHASDKKTEVIYQFAESLLDQKEFYTALEAYECVLDLKPFHLGALVGASTAYFLIGDIHKAGHYARAAQETSPADGRVLQLMKHIEERLG